MNTPHAHKNKTPKLNTHWQPTATLEVLRERAALIQSIRHFFLLRGVLEVETPSLSGHTVTDPFLQPLTCARSLAGQTKPAFMYLQTSPEYAMKRLLAAGFGDIYQITKAYRDDEIGHQHNPEFTMLEWYRVGFDMQQLIDEVGQLLLSVLPIKQIEQASYTELFGQHLQINPTSIVLDDLLSVCALHGLSDYATACIQHNETNTPDDTSKQSTQQLVIDNLLQVLFNQCIEPNIGQFIPMVVTDFPASQAALAVLNKEGNTAKRFEVYFKGLELANGFEELTDADIQLARFKQDNLNRIALGLAEQAIDPNFMAALEHGLPQCSGVAMGVDRLIMLALNKQKISDVLSFNYHNC